MFKIQKNGLKKKQQNVMEPELFNNEGIVSAIDQQTGLFKCQAF